MRSSVGVNIIYFTPEQHQVFHNVNKCVIRAAAGTGKTLLTLLKIVELVKNGTKQIPVHRDSHLRRGKNAQQILIVVVIAYVVNLKVLVQICLVV